MTRPTILVTGATGHTGSAVVAQLRAEGWPVRALVRRRDARSARLESLGASTVVADLTDPEQLLSAMRGTSRAYFLPAFDPFMIQGAVAFADAAREARLEAIVQMSQWLSSPAHPSLATRQVWLVDRLFAALPNTAHVIVNPGMFAENFLRVVDFPALLGIYPVLTGVSRSAPVSNEDIARVVVATLKDPARHAGRSYRPTGPALLSAQEMAGIIAGILGRRVVPMDLPQWMFLRVARMQGVDPFTLTGYRHYMADHQRGAFSADGGVTDVLRELTGQPAESFETTARRYLAQPFAQRTAANRLRAVINFLRVPFSPGYDLDALDRAARHPEPADARLAADDAQWRRTHLGVNDVAVRLANVA